MSRLLLVIVLVTPAGCGRSPQAPTWHDQTPPMPFDCLALAFSPDGHVLVSGGLHWPVTGELRLWNTTSGAELGTFKELGYLAVAFSSDNETFATGSWFGEIALWRTATCQKLAAFRGHQSTINSVAYSPEGRTLATVSDDKTAKLWDLKTQQEKAALAGHSGSVNWVAFSPDGKTLATGSHDGTVRLCD